MEVRRCNTNWSILVFAFVSKGSKWVFFASKAKSRIAWEKTFSVSYKLCFCAFVLVLFLYENKKKTVKKNIHLSNIHLEWQANNNTISLDSLVNVKHFFSLSHRGILYAIEFSHISSVNSLSSILRFHYKKSHF